MSAFYQIRSDVRRVQTRVKRASSPTRHKFTQNLMGGRVRLVRNRSINVSRELVMEHLDELREKADAGILSVCLPDGRPVDLHDPDFAPVGPERVAPPLPNPPLDSVANDTPAGIDMPPQMDGMTASDAEGDAIADELAREILEETGGGVELNADESKSESAPTRSAKRRDRR